MCRDPNRYRDFSTLSSFGSASSQNRANIFRLSYKFPRLLKFSSRNPWIKHGNSSS